MTIHFFDTDIAKKVGVNAAAIFSNIKFWTEKKIANDEASDDGLYYIYNSVKAWHELFNYLTPKQIRTALEKLEKEGLLVSRSDLNKFGYDRTKHYAIPICLLGQLHLPKKAKAFAQKGNTIPDINTDIDTDNKQLCVFDKKPDENNVEDEVFEHWKRVMNSPRSKLDSRRKNLIKKALNDFTVDDCKQAIDGCARTAWNMGDNPNRKIYNSVDLIFRNADNIERFIKNSIGAQYSSTAGTVKSISNNNSFVDKHSDTSWADGS